MEALLSGDLCHGAARGEVALEDDKVALGLDRVGEGADDLLPLGVGLECGKILPERLAGHGHAVAVQETGGEQVLHQGDDATDLDELGHQVFSARLEIGEDGNPFADLGEVVDGKFHAGRVGDGKKMEDGIGGTAEGDHDGDGVLESLAGHDVKGADSPLQEVDHGRACLSAVLDLVAGDRCLRGTVWEAHPHRLDGTGHGVGRVHAAA